MKYLKPISLFALTCVSAMLLLEVYVRGGRIESTLNTDVDRNIGRIRKANAQYVYYNEGMSIGEFNRYGYIGPEYHPQKPANTLRIALLGDSYTEGLYMSEERHFRSLLEEALQQKFPAKNIQLLNFGRSGFDLSDMYAYEKNFVSRFHPDVTLYLINPFDFIQRNTDPLVPYWYLENDSLELNMDFVRSNEHQSYQMMKGILQRSALLQMVKNAYNLAKSDQASSIVLDKLAPEKEDKLTHFKKNYRIEDITQQKVSQAIVNRLATRRDVVIINRDREQWPREIVRWAGVDSSRFVDMGALFTRLDQKGHDAQYWKATNQIGHWNIKTQEYVTTFLLNKLGPILQQHQKSLTPPGHTTNERAMR